MLIYFHHDDDDGDDDDLMHVAKGAPVPDREQSRSGKDVKCSSRTLVTGITYNQGRSYIGLPGVRHPQWRI